MQRGAVEHPFDENSTALLSSDFACTFIMFFSLCQNRQKQFRFLPGLVNAGLKKKSQQSDAMTLFILQKMFCV